MTCRLISIDIDGTIIPDHETNVSEYTSAVLRQLLKKNIILVLNTGRNRQHIDQIILETGIRYALMCNGALIMDFQTDSVLYDLPLDLGLAYRIYHFFSLYPVKVSCFIKGGIYSDTEEKKKSSGKPNRFEKNYLNYIDDLWQSILYQNIPVYKIVLTLDPKTRLFYKDLVNRKFPEVSCTSSQDSILEIGSKQATKGNALKYLMKYLNIGKEETIVIGDNDNDLTAFEIGGFNVVPGNGSYCAKEIADIICDPCKHDGPAKYLAESFLDG